MPGLNIWTERRLRGIGGVVSTELVVTGREATMPAPLSRDLRDRIVRAIEGGSSIRQAALRFAVSPSAAVKGMRRFRESGSPAPERFGGHRRPILEPHEALVRSGPGRSVRHLPCRDPIRAAPARHFGGRNLHDRPLAEASRPDAQKRMARSVCKRVLKRSCVVCANVSGLTSLGPQPRWRSARPGPHKRRGIDAPFFDTRLPGRRSTLRPSSCPSRKHRGLPLTHLSGQTIA